MDWTPTIIEADFKVSMWKIFHQHTLGMFGIHSDLQAINNVIKLLNVNLVNRKHKI